MYSLTLECEVVTPLFMYGADGRTPEIRPSEIKGMMRWWWRAIKAEEDYQTLKEEEEQIFGGTERGGKSKFVVKVDAQNILLQPYHPLPHKRNFSKTSISPGSKFKVSFVTAKQNILKMVENLFYLTTILGGFGFRSRRGFGSVDCDRKSDFKDEEVLEIIVDYLKKIVPNRYSVGDSSLVRNSVCIRNNGRGDDYPWIREILVSGKRYSNYNQLLVDIGNATHRFRTNYLGSSKPRMASPVYVSVIKLGGKLTPIITVLDYNYKVPKDKENFKDRIPDTVDYNSRVPKDKENFEDRVIEIVDPNCRDPRSDIEKFKCFILDLLGRGS